MEQEENRSCFLKFRVSEDELQYIKEKAELSGCRNMSTYLRRMAIMGVIVKYDGESLKEMQRGMVGIQTNINQIALRVNRTGNVYPEDIQELQKKVDEIWQQLTSIQSALLSGKQ